jgi:hypothetical protein
MLTNLSVKLWPETIRSETAANIHAATPNYIAIGTPFDNPCKIFFIQNGTDADLMFSLDGVNDHFALLFGTFLLLDVTTNRADVSGALNIPAGTTIYVKEIGAPTTGSVYLSTFYGK